MFDREDQRLGWPISFFFWSPQDLGWLIKTDPRIVWQLVTSGLEWPLVALPLRLNKAKMEQFMRRRYIKCETGGQRMSMDSLDKLDKSNNLDVSRWKTLGLRYILIITEWYVSYLLFIFYAFINWGFTESKAPKQDCRKHRHIWCLV